MEPKQLHPGAGLENGATLEGGSSIDVAAEEATKDYDVGVL